MTRPGTAFCQFLRIAASPLATIVMFKRFIVFINASWNSWSLLAAFNGVAQFKLMKLGAGSLGSPPGILLRNHGHISMAKAGLTFIACTCTSIIGRCLLREVSCPWAINNEKIDKKVKHEN